MIVWVNGTFGAGKTSACRELVELLPGSLLYDPELVGHGLARMLPPERAAGLADFQDLPSWRRLVPEVAAALLAEVPGPLVVPMTVLREDYYRDEIFGGLASRGLAVHHFVLDAAETILRARIEAHDAHPGEPERSAGIRDRRLEHLARYRAARRWLSRDAELVDTGGLTARQTAERLAALVGAGPRAVRSCRAPTQPGTPSPPPCCSSTNRTGVLFVDPVYKPAWEFPGGVVERGEAPTDAALRETGRRPAPGRLRPAAARRRLEARTRPRRGGLRPVYDGGRLDSQARQGLRLPAEELQDLAVRRLEQAAALLAPGRRRESPPRWTPGDGGVNCATWRPGTRRPRAWRRTAWPRRASAPTA